MAIEMMEDGSLACELCLDDKKLVRAMGAVQCSPARPPPQLRHLFERMERLARSQYASDFGIDEDGVLILCLEHKKTLMQQGVPEINFQLALIIKQEEIAEHIHES